MTYHVPRTRRTALTAALILVVTVPFVASTVDLARAGFGTLDEQMTLTLVAYEWDPEAAGFFLQLAAVLMGALCVWCGALAVGVFARVETSRIAGLLTFTALGLVSSMLALGALVADQRPAGWLSAVAVAALNVTIAWLLWSGEVADDISRGAHARQRRRRLAQEAGSEAQ